MQARQVKGWAIARKPVAKIMLSDGPGSGDRDANDPKSVWHNDRGRPWFPTLWGDGHVSNCKFPNNRQLYDDGRPPAPDGDPTLPQLSCGREENSKSQTPNSREISKSKLQSSFVTSEQ